MVHVTPLRGINQLVASSEPLSLHKEQCHNPKSYEISQGKKSNDKSKNTEQIIII